MGGDNTIYGDLAVGLGGENKVKTTGAATAIGYNNDVSGNGGPTAIGMMNTVSANMSSTAIGFNNTVVSASTAVGSFCFGTACEARGENRFAIGFGAEAGTTGFEDVVFAINRCGNKNCFQILDSGKAEFYGDDVYISNNLDVSGVVTVGTAVQTSIIATENPLDSLEIRVNTKFQGPSGANVYMNDNLDISGNISIAGHVREDLDVSGNFSVMNGITKYSVGSNVNVVAGPYEIIPTATIIQVSGGSPGLPVAVDIAVTGVTDGQILIIVVPPQQELDFSGAVNVAVPSGGSLAKANTSVQFVYRNSSWWPMGLTS